jgi:hypothetical protein
VLGNLYRHRLRRKATGPHGCCEHEASTAADQR